MVCEMYCIVLNKFIVFSSVDGLNLKFKKQSEKLKHYEGEHFKIADTRQRGREREREMRDDKSIS